MNKAARYISTLRNNLLRRSWCHNAFRFCAPQKAVFPPADHWAPFTTCMHPLSKVRKRKQKQQGRLGERYQSTKLPLTLIAFPPPLDDCFSPVQGPFFHFRPVYPYSDSPPNVTFPPWLIPVTFPHFSCHSSAGSTNTITLSKVSVLSNQARGPDQMVSCLGSSRGTTTP